MKNTRTWRTKRLAVAALLMAAMVVAAPSPASAACGDAPAPGVDWSNCAFSFANLADVDLAGANLAGVDLSYAVLFRANLSGANLRGANLHDAFPIGANLAGADLSDADLSDADLVGANLGGAVLRRTKLSRSDVDFSSIANASFVGADLTDADFTNVSGADTATFGLAPAVTSDVAITWQERALTLAVVANDNGDDVNPFAAETVRVEQGPSGGTFNSGTGVYTPAAGFSGNDQMTYRLVHTLPWDNLPTGAVTTFVSEPTTVTIEVKPVVRVGPPYAGMSGAEGEIVRLYVALLRRVPDAAGFDYWVAQRRSGRSLLDIATFFQGSSEFLSDNGGLSDVAFVTLLYNNVLERSPDSGGLDYWSSQLSSSSLARNHVALAFSESPEFRTLTSTS